MAEIAEIPVGLLIQRDPVRESHYCGLDSAKRTTVEQRLALYEIGESLRPDPDTEPVPVSSTRGADLAELKPFEKELSSLIDRSELREKYREKYRVQSLQTPSTS
jgi:hypothetical protein